MEAVPRKKEINGKGRKRDEEAKSLLGQDSGRISRHLKNCFPNILSNQLGKQDRKHQVAEATHPTRYPHPRSVAPITPRCCLRFGTPDTLKSPIPPPFAQAGAVSASSRPSRTGLSGWVSMDVVERKGNAVELYIPYESMTIPTWSVEYICYAVHISHLSRLVKCWV